MTKASDNIFPKLIGAEGAAPATPAAASSILYVKADGLWYSKDDAGVETLVSGGAAGMTNPMTTQGDIISGGASGAPGRLAIGTAGQVLTVNAGATAPEWAAAGGGGGGATIQYPALKPATPTYDFAGASLDAAFVAQSSQGSFALANCMTQGIDWMGSALELQFSEQMGMVYVPHADADFDFTWGGIYAHGFRTTASMAFGIAALNTSGTGVGLYSWSDNSMYFGNQVSWQYDNFSSSWGNGGWPQHPNNPVWLRLKRVSGVWTAYASYSGRAWDKVFSTRSDSVTVAYLAFGLVYATSSSYSGRLTADFCHVAV